MNWRLIISGTGNAANNMAIDEALMLSQTASGALPALRLYGWHPAAVSLGYFQKTEKAIDLASCSDHGIDVVRRLTGGRAVYHAAELTYSITIREDHPIVPQTITASYMLFSNALQASLRELGITTQLTMPQSAYSQGKRVKTVSAACFDAPSHYEMIVGEQKLVGSAQVRKNGVVLQHGSILLDFSAESLADVLHTQSPNEKIGLVEMLKKRATSLTEQLGRKVSWDEVAAVITEAFGPALGIRLVSDKLTVQEKEIAEQLAASKYSQDSWNQMR
ncbi:MAG: biotin/lipoate protein ligase [Firmicutes bacterium]|nr:biotin/lipoate protein ligase [Bacillota bacterium]